MDIRRSNALGRWLSSMFPHVQAVLAHDAALLVVLPVLPGPVPATLPLHWLLTGVGRLLSLSSWCHVVLLSSTVMYWHNIVILHCHISHINFTVRSHTCECREKHQVSWSSHVVSLKQTCKQCLMMFGMESTTTTLEKIFTGYGSNFVGKHSKLVIPSSEYHTLYSKHCQTSHTCLPESQPGWRSRCPARSHRSTAAPHLTWRGSRLIILWKILHQQLILIP